VNTLTKVLIVLLTLSSIFLCGIVVTYVANADNYRQKYNALRSDNDSLSEKVKDLTEQVNEKIDEMGRLEKKLNSEIAALKDKFGKAQNDLKNAEREKAALLQKVNSFASIVEGFSQTNNQQGLLLNNTLVELDKVQTEQLKQRQELEETTAALVEKMAIIDTLQADKKRLLEERTELQSRMDQLLRPFGKEVPAIVPVTPKKEIAKPAKVDTGDIDLQGLVATVDLKNSMAEISIGSADGVKEGMVFHVTRGEEFICDILILEVDPEKAVGILELMQQQPRVGDNVSTNL